MTYQADVLEFLIASPGDVAEERDIVRQVIAVWNATYARDRRVVLMPVGWETHSSPELSGRPQQLINDRILIHADVLVGIFWTRVGSPTGMAISGSVEEIERHLAMNKPVMLYFSNAPAALDSVDPAQYQQLTEFKSWARNKGLIESFGTRDEFREKFQRQLPLVLRDNKYVASILKTSSDGTTSNDDSALARLEANHKINSDALELLTAAAADPHGLVLIHKSITGTSISSNGRSFCDDEGRRLAARWEAAVHQLTNLGLISDRNGRGLIFEITEEGYRAVEIST